MNIQTATASDLFDICQLLGTAGLPVDDIDARRVQDFLVLREGGRLVAVVGVEACGPHALLRSLAVVEPLRGGGVGRALFEAAQRRARAAGYDALYLLTTSASDYFVRLGFVRVARSEAPQSIRATTQFGTLCPATAVLMRKTMSHTPYNVLFLCTGNSARSILAEALINNVPGHVGKFRGYSAGSQPRGEVHPMALRVLRDAGLATDGLRSKSWDEFSGEGVPQMDFIFTVCDNAANEVCPVWPGHPATAHWGLPDPAAVGGDDEAQHQAFHQTLIALRRRIDLFAELPFDKLDRLSLQQKLHEVGRG
jgi:protein-tyrosine-phosphatase/N-acetylglutamate synthase-like GNAT family acetyltransferase